MPQGPEAVRRVEGLGLMLNRLMRIALRNTEEQTLPDGRATSRLGRFREILSDPLNLLIRRVPTAGHVIRGGLVVLHNGNVVPRRGRGSYYGDFSDILVINRGVHEPLEEFCFQRVLGTLANTTPTMIEVGAYWAHYSMWLKSLYRDARCILAEPCRSHLLCGRKKLRTKRLLRRVLAGGCACRWAMATGVDAAERVSEP